MSIDIEYFSKDEEKTLHELLAKQKRIQRAQSADKKFFSQVDARKDEILRRWGISSGDHGISDGGYSTQDEDNNFI